MQRGDHPQGSGRARPVFQLVQRGEALVIMPRAADHDHPGQAELFPDDLHDAGEGGRVAGVARHTRTATGRRGLVSSRTRSASPPFSPSWKYSAASGTAQPSSQEDDRSSAYLAGVGLRGQMPGGQLRLDGILLVFQPVHCRVDVIGGCPGHAQVGAQRGVGRTPRCGGQLGGLEPPPGTPSAPAPGRAAGGGGAAGPGSSAGRRSHARLRRAHAAATRRSPPPAAGPAGAPFSAASIALTACSCSPDRFARVQDLHPAAVAVGAPQVAVLIIAATSLPVHVAAAYPGHMHR